ncbi:MAG: 6,7-dimethyl-8-ribityllumazine synthase [Planctomycetes bacterium]|nr:6,7-dimethyl-8-ribityllumazine synthase [Planctomycetota bacterium]
MVRIPTVAGDGATLRLAVVRARFNSDVTERLLQGALATLKEAGVRDDATFVIEVPGAVELALAAELAFDHLAVDAVVCLGAVIRGETSHYDYVCSMTADSLARLMVERKKPIAFGVLTCDDDDQALARAGGDAGNKGSDAAAVALEMAHLARHLARLAPGQGAR